MSEAAQEVVHFGSDEIVLGRLQSVRVTLYEVNANHLANLKRSKKNGRGQRTESHSHTNGDSVDGEAKR